MKRHLTRSGVATNVSSIPEIVADGETGELVPPDDAPALAAAVTRVLDDPGTYGAVGRARARNQFSVALQDPRNRKHTSDVRITERISSVFNSRTESLMKSVVSKTDTS